MIDFGQCISILAIILFCQVILAPSKASHDQSSRSMSCGSRQQEFQVRLGSA